MSISNLTINKTCYFELIYNHFFRNQSLLVFNLGCLKIKSKPQNIEDISTIQVMHRKGASPTEVLQEIVSRSYDRYFIELENAQVILFQQYLSNDMCNSHIIYSILDIDCQQR